MIYVSESAPNRLPLERHVAIRSLDLHELEESISKGGFMERRTLHYARGHRRLDAQISQFKLGRVQLVGVHLGSNIVATSVPLEAVQILVPVSGRVIDSSHDRRETAVAPGSAIIHGPNQPVRVTWEPDSSCLSVRIPESSLREIFHAHYEDFLPDNFRFCPFVNLAQGSGQSLANVISGILREIDTGSLSISGGRVSHLWEELLIEALFRLQPPLSRTQEHPAGISSKLVYYHVRRAIEYMTENLDQPISIAELVAASGVSQRTLQTGFQKCFGTGPMTYLRRRKLSRVKAELAAADPAETTVGDVAARWGFLNPSHFTMQYRKLFGELPSTTLGTRTNGFSRIQP